MFTKELILEKIQENDINFFKELHYEDTSDEVETVYDENWGDGNDWVVVLSFPKLGMFVRLDGYYSSWDSSELESACLAEPYEHTEIRYREIK